MHWLKTHSRVALGYFLTAAILGLVLRSFHIFKIPITYKFIVHTHSHIALLGWVYLGLTTLIYKLYLQKKGLHKKYRRIFWFTQITLLGMLFSFPFQGYALFSIIFSTLFLIASYWFFWFFRKNVTPKDKEKYSFKCINAALWFMVISSIGPWALGAIMNILGATSIWYRLAIYFYLHFQYNGWMILSLTGIFFYILEQRKIIISTEKFNTIFWLLCGGIIASFFLSTLFTEPHIILNVIGGIGGIFQFIAIWILVQLLVKQKKELNSNFSKFQFSMLKTIGLLLFLKMGLQILTALPYFADLAVSILDFTIGYLHWTFLGVITLSLFLFFDYFELLKIQKKGYYLYLIGFIATEAFIFYKGLIIWQNVPLFDGYFISLAIASLFIILGLSYIFIASFRNKKETL